MSLIGKLKLNTPVLVNTKEKFKDQKGIVKYIGKLQGKKEQFIGVQLQVPQGLNSGENQGKTYFQTKPNHGLFLKAKNLSFVDGTAIQSLLINQPIKKISTIKNPVKTSKVHTTNNQNKLSNEINEANNQQINQLKQKLQIAEKTINQLKVETNFQQLQSMKEKCKELEEKNRVLKLGHQKSKHISNQNLSDKQKGLNEKISFFQSQKQSMQKQKIELKKKISRLQLELQQQQQKDSLLDNLTYKLQKLEETNQKLRIQCENLSTELKNTKIFGSNTTNEDIINENNTNERIDIQKFKENIKILNQTTSLLQMQLQNEKQKNIQLQKQIINNVDKLTQYNKLQRKLQSRNQQIQSMKLEVQTYSDAASFVQKLTLDLLKKQQNILQMTNKINQYIEDTDKLQAELNQNKQIAELQAQLMEDNTQEIEKLTVQKQQQQEYINSLTRQLSKYKQKISQLTQNTRNLNESNLQISMVSQVDQSKFTTIDYQQRYYQVIRVLQSTGEKNLQQKLQYTEICNGIGIRMMNIVDTLPEKLLNKFYPEVMNLIIQLKNTNDKLYLLFNIICSYFHYRNSIFNPDNVELITWMLMVLEQIPLLYGLILKILIALYTVDSEEQLSEIMSHRILSTQIIKIDVFVSEILQRISTDNIDCSLDLSTLIDTTENIHKISIELKKVNNQQQKKIFLCTQGMRCLHKIYQCIKLFKNNSELQQNIQIDSTLETFLRLLLIYLHECCLNPHLRFKPQMKSYLEGMDFLTELCQQIQKNQQTHLLGNLYVEVEEIKLLKQTILTTQFHMKQLIADLKNVQYTNPLQKIQVNLSGKVWQNSLKAIKQELTKFEELKMEKEELEKNMIQSKIKILTMEKQIRDKQSTKQLYEKNIGELQLKVQQNSLVQEQNIRLKQKVQLLKITNKTLQEELKQQTRKMKYIQQDTKKLSSKLEAVQSSTLGHKKGHQSTVQKKQDIMNDLNSQMKYNAVNKQCQFFKNLDLKKKCMQLKFSTIISARQQKNQNKSIQQEKMQLRRKALEVIADMQVHRCGCNAEEIRQQVAMNSIYKQVYSLNFKELEPENKIKKITIGHFELPKYQIPSILQIGLNQKKIYST